MILRNSLTATTLVLLAAAGSDTAWASADSADQAAATARCIIQTLPRGGQIYRGSDGSVHVRATGRRGLTARWTISPDGAIAQTGGTAGLARSVAKSCS